MEIRGKIFAAPLAFQAERSGERTKVDNGKDRQIRMLLPCCSPAVLLQ